MKISLFRSLGFASLILIAATSANATVSLEDQTWTELSAEIKAGTTTIIIPIGGTEQNGPDMALGKHNVRVKFLAEKIAEKLGNALVAPVVSYVPEGEIDPPTQHMKFPGTITISEKTFEQILESAARSFRHHGFKTIVFIGDHGSYQANEGRVADRLNAEWANDKTKVFAAREYYSIVSHGYFNALLRNRVPKADIGTHAGLSDTSLMLAIDPSMVRTGRLKSGPKLGASDGVYNGDPRRSSAELGQIGVKLIINGTADAISKFVEKQQLTK